MTDDKSTTHLHIVDDKLVESIGHHVTCLLVRAIPNTGHQILTLEPSTYSVINTFRLPPVNLCMRGGDWASRQLVIQKFLITIALLVTLF